MGSSVVSTLGLQPCRAFYRDRAFLGALWLGGMFWLCLALAFPVSPLSWPQAMSWPFVSLALVQPCMEELLFRGALQGTVKRCRWGQLAWQGYTSANVVAALLFMVGHWWQHPPLWALAVFLPALLFGWLRDHYDSVYPAMVLHAVYNTGYFWLTGLPA
jgi:membrane protease YdiL (CAAX protease family)